MTLDFNLGDILSIEFGVGRESGDDLIYRLLPVDNDVQTALVDMAFATRSAMDSLADNPIEYEPSEKHEAKEYLGLP